MGSYEKGNNYLNKGNLRYIYIYIYREREREKEREGGRERRVLNIDKNKRMACVKNKTRKKQEHLGGEGKDIKSNSEDGKKKNY